MKTYLTALFLIASHAAFSATWHVDPAYTGNVITGTSWDTPWKRFADIVWTKVRPGDAVEIAQGSFGDESLVIASSGTEALPICIRLATDPSRRGPVKFRAISFSANSSVVVDGSLNPSFVAPLSVHDLYQITNNIGIHLQNPTGPGVYLRGSTVGNRVLWVETYRCGESATRETHGIHINGDTRRTEIGYCWVHDQHWGDGINRGSGISPPDFTDLQVHDTLITRPGQDAFQVGGGGADIYRCFIDGWHSERSSGHPDAFQTWGSYYRIHHNIVRDFSPGENYYASLAYAQMSNPVNGNYLLYNNLFVNELVPTETGFMFLFDAWFSPDKHNTNVIVTNLLVANNLWHIWKGSSVGHTFHYASDKSRGTNDYYTITNCYFLNNSVIQCNSQIANSAAVSLASTNLQPSNIGYYQWMFDYNIVAGPSSFIRYMGSDLWPNAESLNRASPFQNNSSQLPAFRQFVSRQPPYDFRLDPVDNVASSKGTNLMTWLSIAPMINIDLDGQRRNPTKPWDIGPYKTDPIPPLPDDPCEQLRNDLEAALERIRILENP